MRDFSRPARWCARARAGVLGAGGLALLLSCESATAPDGRPGWALQPSILLHHGVPAFVQIPESVRRDSLFQVGFTTFGPGCDEQGGTEVDITGMTINVHPMDFTPVTAPTAGPCPANVVRIFGRVIKVRFRQPGEGVIRVFGRREPGGQAITLTARLTVR